MRFPSRRALVLLATLLALSATPARAAGQWFRMSITRFGSPAAGECSSSNHFEDQQLAFSLFERFQQGECMYVRFLVDGGGASTSAGRAPVAGSDASFEVRVLTHEGRVVATAPAGRVDITSDEWGTGFRVDQSWPAGELLVEARPTRPGDTGFARYRVLVNALGLRLLLPKLYHVPGEPLTVRGVVWKRASAGGGTAEAFVNAYPEDPSQADNVPGSGTVSLRRADGRVVTKPFQARSSQGEVGFFDVTFSSEEYGPVRGSAPTGFAHDFEITGRAFYEDDMTGIWRSAPSDPDSRVWARFLSLPDRAEVRATYTSETGWVAPGREYVHVVDYRNASSTVARGVTLQYTIPDGARWIASTPPPASLEDGVATWRFDTIAARADWFKKRRILIRLRSATLRQDPQVMWKDLSGTVTISQQAMGSLASSTLGPRVTTRESSRFGERPFPIVLVEYMDAKHSPARPGWYFQQLGGESRRPSLASLYEAMSFGQLRPRGVVASSTATDTTFGVANDYRWSSPLPGGACVGVSRVPSSPSSSIATFTPPATEPRIIDGWYQLPGTQAYYGGDELSAGELAARIAGFGYGIDGACGPTAKAAFDAASIADPDIDYNDFDTDRNGVADFFMFMSRGLGGNGSSQARGGYDAVWPHSWNLEYIYSDDNGQRGYVSRDQLRDRFERPMWWKDAEARRDDNVKALTTKNMGDALKAFVRVGPYNANPEISTAAVIAHEYGHSLGLPDFYSSSNRTTVEDWDLMASDRGQFMSARSRQDLGWIVPRVLRAGTVTPRLRESKIDTHRIHWIDPSGKPYALSGPKVHNADAWYVPLPHPPALPTIPDGTFAWWSGSGDDFGCPGHTLDVRLPLMKQASPGDVITLSMKSWFEIEWDYDYGFVLVSTDQGKTFESLPSAKNTTTPKEWNPYEVPCQAQLGNGITGSSGHSNFPADGASRTLTTYPEPSVIDDEFDLSAFAGNDIILRFAYSTDAGVKLRGWGLDEIQVKNETKDLIYFDDGAESADPGLRPSGWSRQTKDSGGSAERGYTIELRDRVGFDFDGRWQNTRYPITWAPGVSLWWTDRTEGWGNNGQPADVPPNQTPLDSRPQPKDATPFLVDAAFVPLPNVDSFDDTFWVDNYAGPEPDGTWKLSYGCLLMRVHSITGLGRPNATADITLTARQCRRVRRS